MRLDLAAVAREAAARWRQDRSILAPLSGLFLFVPQWATSLFVPDPPRIPAGRDPAAAQAWWEAMQAWSDGYGGWTLAAVLLAQFGQLALIALYLAPGERPTAGHALMLAARRLPRFVLAGLVIAVPIGLLALMAAGAPPLAGLAVPVVVYLPVATWS